MTLPTEYPGWSFGREGQGPLVEWERHYRLRDEVISASLGTRLPSEVADLIDIAIAVFVTDRLCRRRPHRAPDDGTHWSRGLHAQVAVRCPDRWRDERVSSVLNRLLCWLTDDEWTLTFVGGGPRLARRADNQDTLFEEPLEEPASVGLLSGGLDSLLGAAAELDRPGELLLVSTATHNKLGNRQHHIARELASIGSRPVRWLGVPVNLTPEGKSLPGAAEEPSQRTRAFVFLALGVAAAVAAHCDELRVYENGPGSLNLALNAGQRGAMNTRAMRPETLGLMGQLVTEVLGRPFEVVNPNQWRTKAEMCAAARPELDELVALCRSCDTALIGRRPGDAPCGRCTSCVLRRQALLAAGRGDLDARDVRQMRGDSLRAQVPGLIEPSLRLMVGQVHALSACLTASEPWRALVHRWPDLATARRALAAEPGQVIDLLSRYCAEWEQLDVPVIQRALAA